MADNSYYVTLPNSGVTAEVTAQSTRQARTVYLDHLTRSGVVPWRGRTDLRDQIIIDRIDPGQIPTDIQLSYGQQQPIDEEELEVNGAADLNGYGSVGADYTDDPYGEEDYSEYAPQQPTYQNGSAFGGSERQVRSEWDQTAQSQQESYRYEDELPSYTAPQRQRMTPARGNGTPAFSPGSSQIAGTLPTQQSIPSPAAVPNKLPGLAPGQKIPMTPSSSNGHNKLKIGPASSPISSAGNLIGESKIGKIAKELFPKGKV